MYVIILRAKIGGLPEHKASGELETTLLPLMYITGARP
jgi:hypothetical protein